jgi:AcrR family transcriptional regulator
VGRTTRERDAEVAREAILEAAEETFAREGFDGARVDTIATESGYNKSLIFHYFTDKEGLYRAVIARMKARMQNELLEPLTAFIESSDEISTHRVRLFLEMAINSYLEFLIKHPRNLRMMAWEAAEGWHTYIDCSANKEILAHRASILCAADFLRRAQVAGAISQEVDVRFLLIHMMNMCITHLINLPRYDWFFDQPEGEREASLALIRRQVIHIVLYGIFTPSQEGTHA